MGNDKAVRPTFSTPTNPAQLYEAIRRSADVNWMLKRRTPEGLFLEYKKLSTPLTGDDRRNIAKGVCAFANADGGVILFGIATGNGTERTMPISRRDIPMVSDIVEEIRAEIAQWVSPPVVGIQFRTIGRPNGLIALFVPQSLTAPHMSLLEHRYYQRHGNRSLPMEHYQIADLFGRRRQTIITMEFKEPQLVSTGARREASIEMWVKNSGKAMGRDLLLAVDVVCEEGYQGEFGIRLDGWVDRTQYTGFQASFSKPHEKQYPGTSGLAGQLLVPTTGPERFGIRWSVVGDNVDYVEGSVIFAIRSGHVSSLSNEPPEA